MAKIIKHPTAEALRKQADALLKENKNLRQRLQEREDRITALEDEGIKDPTEYEEQIKNLEDRIGELECDLDLAQKEKGEPIKVLQDIAGDLADVIRQVKIVVQGGPLARHHEISPQALLQILQSWLEEVSTEIKRQGY